MVQTEVKPQKPLAVVSRTRYLVLAMQFLSLWAFFVMLITMVALAMNIDWARPKVQSMLAESLHRRVALGKLTWTFGLNGLAIDSNKMSVSEIDGAPFLRAGKSEIGIAFLPLLRGEIKIRHLTFQNPELWAMRLPGGKWNFSDLLQTTLDIHFIEIANGKLHLIDVSGLGKSIKAAWLPYNFENVQLKLVWPRKNHRWPFYLAFNLPGSGYVSRIKINALGSGQLSEWQNKNYQCELTAEQLNPADLGPFSKMVPAVSGLCSVKLAGEGIMAKGWHATVGATMDKLKLPNGIGQISNVTGTAHLIVSTDKITWTKLVAHSRGLEIQSRGQVLAWQKGNQNYRAFVAGKIADLGQLTNLVNRQDGADQRDKKQGTGFDLSHFLAPGKLGGTADFEITASGQAGKDPQLYTNIRASGLSTSSLWSQLPAGTPHWLAVLCKLAASKMQGQISIDPDGHIEAPKLEIISQGSVLHLSGSWHDNQEQSKLDFEGQNLDLGSLSNQLLSDPDFAHMLSCKLALPAPRQLKMAGRLNVKGHLKGRGNNQSCLVTAQLVQAAIAMKDGSLTTRNIDGSISLGKNTVSFNDLHGNMDGGTFSLNGQVDLGKSPRLDVVFNADHLDLADLETALKVLKVKLPIFTEHQLSGRVRSLALSINGSPEAPQIRFAAVPENLFYQPPGLSRPLRAVGGDITYKNDRLTLKDVELATKSNKLIASLTIDKLSTHATLQMVKVKTAGIDLSDLNAYLSSTLMPEAIRKEYLDFVNKYQVASTHGKAYGDLLWQLNKSNDFTVEGVVGFFNLGGRFANYPLEHVSGILGAAGPELLVQDFSGTIGRSTFAVDGHIKNYRDKNATWQGQLRSEVYPEELLKLIPQLAESLNGHILSSGAITVRANATGDRSSSQLVFSAVADTADNLRIVAPFGIISQPQGEDLTLDGSMKIKLGDGGFVDVHDSHLLIGNSSLQARGKYTWFASSSGLEPQLHLRLSSPTPVAATILVACLEPSAKLNGVKGTVTGSISARGPLSAIVTQGHIDFDDVCLPQFSISQVKGRIETPKWVLSAHPNQLLCDPSVNSTAKLHLDSLSNGDLVANDLNADIVFGCRPGDKSQLITVNNGQASLAGGSLKFNGWLNLNDQKVHLQCGLVKVDADRVISDLLGHNNEISGQADVAVTLDSQGSDYKTLLHNLDGTGSINIHGGKVARFGELQEKLAQANLMHQGIFGFNLNNLLQSVVPVRTGNFHELASSFEISSGIISIDELRYNGDDMLLWAAGSVNLPSNTIQIEVAGKVPRVASSIIGGAVGQVSKHFTLQNFFHIVTMHKLENLPSLPILGEIASDRPRAFSFKVTAPADKPSAIAQSIEKSFHWLPTHPNASARPVPGLQTQQ